MELLFNGDYPDLNLVDIQGDKLWGLSKSSRINIFVGSNNSGKSYILRHLLKKKSYLFGQELLVIKEKLTDFNAIVSNILNINVGFPAHFGNVAAGLDIKFINVLHGRNKVSIPINAINPSIDGSIESYYQNVEKLVSDEMAWVNFYFHILKKNERKDQYVQAYIGKYNLNDEFSTTRIDEIRKADSLLNELLLLTKLEENEVDNKIFIPTLRTAHSLFNLERGKYKKVSNDILLNTIKKNYEINDDSIDVFTGHRLYYDIISSSPSVQNFSAVVSRRGLGGVRGAMQKPYL